MEQQGQTSGGSYPTPGAPPPPGQLAKSQHPLTSLFGGLASAEFPDARNKSGTALKVFGILLLGLIAAGGAYVALSGASLLMPRSAEARAEAMARSPRAVSDAQTVVQTVQTQLMLYKLQHNDRLPTLAQLQDNWDVLAKQTYVDGSLAVDGAATVRGKRTATYGPYLREVPVNPLTNSSKVAAAGKATVEHGFTYDQRSGKVWAVAAANSEQVRRAPGYFEVAK